MALLDRAAPARPAAAGRLDLAAIERALWRLRNRFTPINESLRERHDPLGDGVVVNLIEGYRLLDQLLADDIDLFAFGQLRHLLDLNDRVLRGRPVAAATPGAPAPGDAERAAAEQRFYEQPGGGVRDLVEWHGRHRRDDVWRRAAGALARLLTEPQLFVEGNHRTGTLLMSWILVRAGRPPIVLTPALAPAFLDQCAALRRLRKGSVGAFVRLPRATATLATLLEAHADPQFLR